MRERTVLRRAMRGARNTRVAAALACVLTGVCLLGLPGTVGAATQIGETFAGATGSCDTGTAIQSTSPGSPPEYSAPSAGVITSWSFHASPIAAPTLLKLKFARPLGGNAFTIVGESPAKSPSIGALSTYTDVRIPVEAGDVIGFYTESASDDAECFRAVPGGGFDFHAANGDQLPGSTADYTPIGLSAQMTISAVLEPDCDSDGFGDETQDPSPACPRTLTLDANKNKVKKGKKVTLSGQVLETRQGGACAASQPVELYRKRPSQTSFVLVERLQTDPAGNFSAKQKVKKTFEYRAVVPETATCAGQTSNTEQVKVKKPK
jgi:hypothetical protein